ncbi:MAG TPA: isochorismatase family cysteine hydrolase [Candidatus Dormibacteraeota bacterium]|nr:isochorismatase family cysteine hydrolase [Candidatus Dormibacteraeota bacterium]
MLDAVAIVFQLRRDRSALLVVDMQNDFVRLGAPMEVPDARETIDVHLELLGWFRAQRRPVAFTRFIAGPSPTLMWKWSPVIAPPTCCCWPGFMRAYGDIEGERDCVAVIDELAPLPGEPQVDKYGYNGFHRTRLTDLLVAHGVDTVLITGTVTQICVEDTTRGAFHEGFQAVVVSDAVSSYVPDLHRASLQTLAMKYGRVMTAQEAMHEMET